MIGVHGHACMLCVDVYMSSGRQRPLPPGRHEQVPLERADRSLTLEATIYDICDSLQPASTMLICDG